MTPVEVKRGNSPVLLGLPHSGTHVPADIMHQLSKRGQALADTDWHIHQLYDGLLAGATTVRATFHRYVIDANRDPSGASLYPGQNTTGLVPLTDFDGHDIWRSPPDATEVERRRIAFHAPYHAALKGELARLKAIHGFAILYDCHSIRSEIPFLFAGRLPDFSIGTNEGITCAAQVEAAVLQACNTADGYSTVLNGRFMGGWTTRQYGQPESGIHAIQMELAQSTYLTAERPPWAYDASRAARLRKPLGALLENLAKMALKTGDIT